ncbi:hypothetical protein [Pseudomonas frederiksbergensis]|uniref:Uncharacterized protein n=1 Tax=Pseudomonas frederiksbergensis TaxID=104087 RepID=A0A423HNQ3_9PSED|nr:hypothetical protein [Pseudomonas frederiksbergensis]RON14813.1 hypothetical protein BK662_15010 [Pseudomonas frederiksbergensis]
MPSSDFSADWRNAGAELILDSVPLLNRDQHSAPSLTIDENWFTSRDYLFEQLIKIVRCATSRPALFHCHAVTTPHPSRSSIQSWIRFKAFTRPKQFKKTPSPASTFEAADEVVSFSRLKKPKTPFFPCPLDFFRANNSAIGGSVRVVLLQVIERHAKAPIINDHCITDKSRNGYGVFSKTRLYKTTQLKVTEILTMKFDFDDFRHPAKAPK